ncbi:alpha-2,8-polysialyltransferase family protein [Moraxella nasicaprae]|uniref:Alpha-2,8-polysialyltransferase family protein n=1 Tax=Moraxella nasicaprae TaxID=2904122 RepID=A0ABY6F1Y9_9GAMM|nr:alpha-2,8-polysialyltransferase family protein [Moraxella nasicaprae]UXZ04104.1 alpha-2,8-polysialyltransferase family protein [Moraxella nasicaprae]
MLELQSGYAQTFVDYLKAPQQVKNLFVVTHLGQLKQMESLIQQKQLKNNLLVILYTMKNLDTPKMVVDNISQNCFSGAITVEIPVGINKISYSKLNEVQKTYGKILNAINFDDLYVNSFEGHYAILLNMAKNKKRGTILVEEGTAIYKPISEMPTQQYSLSKYKKVDFKFLKSHFMTTIGETQIFKKGVKIKKNIKKPTDIFPVYKKVGIKQSDILDGKLLKQIKNFALSIDKDLGVQRDFIRIGGNGYLKSALSAYVDFDKVYASSPKLLADTFKNSVFERFFIYDWLDEESVAYAKSLIAKYKIGHNDILFLNQRYELDLRLYMTELRALLLSMADQENKIFVKLHPKDGDRVRVLFNYLEQQSDGRIVIIEEQDFLVESLLKVSGIKKVVGITSSVLMYAHLINQDVEAISIANYLIDRLSSYSECQKGLEDISIHLHIIYKFDSIQVI